MKVSTVLLDAGGVILDESEHESIRAEITVEVISSIIPGYSLENYWDDIDEAVSSFCPSTYKYVFWKYLKPDVGQFSKLYARSIEKWRERRTPLKIFDGIADEIKQISSNFVVALAGQYGSEMLDLFIQHNILDCFANRLTQDDFIITKPDPRYYEQIVTALGVSPEECVMVGDRIDKDIIPAKQLGMRTIRIRTGIHCNQNARIPSEIPDLELYSISGLADAVYKLVR